MTPTPFERLWPHFAADYNRQPGLKRLGSTARAAFETWAARRLSKVRGSSGPTAHAAGAGGQEWEERVWRTGELLRVGSAVYLCTENTVRPPWDSHKRWARA